MRRGDHLNIALANMPGIGPATVRTLLARFGTAKKTLEAPRRELERMKNLRPESVAAIVNNKEYVRAAQMQVKEVLARGFDIVTLGAENYPSRLLDLRDAPPVLYVKGELPRDDERTFAVAGSKEPTAKGLKIANSAGRYFGKAGWTLVSGYAPGVDGAAHLGALEAGGKTVLCLPMGILAFALRPEFRKFESELGGRLVLMSECAPDSAWSASSAVRRDRLIAALGEALLVVEAKLECGTMITFRHAKKLGRPVYVIKYQRPPAWMKGNAAAIKLGGIPVQSGALLRQIANSKMLAPSALKKQKVLF